MHRTILFLVLLIPSVGIAQTIETSCAACRDVRTYPVDFGNHAFNETFVKAEDASTIFSVEVIVKNGSGQTAYVHLARVMDYSGLSISLFPFLSYQVPYPSPYVQIAVQDAWGKLTRYQVLVSSHFLMVGDTQPVQESEPEPEPEPVANKSPGGLDLLGGYDASANYYGGASIPYYDFRLINE